MMMLEETTHNGESVLSFLEAAAKGNVEKVMRSLHINPGLINTPHPETGSTALIAAAEENHSEVITLLLEHGADVTACNSANQTAVHVADDGVRAQLLSAVTRTSYPQLSMLQAAWQGDLGSVRHLLSTDPGQSVHTRNAQGLTPAMLVLRDVDLFVSVTMRHDYRPVEVLQELLTHNADADLLDSGGRSAFSYVSEVKNPLRRQLMDALERCAPPPDAHGEASCDLGIKPPLHDAPPAGVIQKRKSKEVNRPSSDGISSDILTEKRDRTADLRPQPDFQKILASEEMENFDQMQERKRNRYSRYCCADPTPGHLTPRSAIKRHIPHPPLYTKSEEEVSKLERSGPLQQSYTEPNISQCDPNPNPLPDIRGRIWKRLISDKSNSKNFPPVSQIPQSPSPVPARLKPLSKGNEETSRSNTAPSCDNHEEDGSSETAKDKDRTRPEGKEAAEERETPRNHLNCRDVKSLMIADDKARIENSAEMEMVSGERFRTNRQRQVKEEDLPDMRKEKELKIRDKNKVTEGILWTAPPRQEDTKKKVEPKNMATSKTSKTNPVELSKQDHSVNKATQKENVKTAKKRKTGKISSQDNIQQQRPLPKSNQTHGKSVPLPPVVSTRVSYSAQGGSDRSVQRSHNQVSQKQKSSSSNTPTPLIAKSSYNLNYISYSHMFNELPSLQGAGPVIQEMFPSTLYGNVPNFRGEISSASATGRSRSGSIRDHSARLKRSELNEKTPSPPNLLSKQEGIEMGPNKTDMVNSGTNWAIRSNKHGGIHGIQALDKMTDAKHQNSELPIIIEASTENSITDTGTFKETLKTMNFLDKRSINVVCNNSENVDTDLPKEAGGVQQNFSFINSSCRRDTENVQVPKSGRTPPPSQDLSATETPSQLQPDEALEDWGNSHGYQGGHSVEPKYDEEDKCFSPRSTEGSHNPAGSGHLSAKPGSCFKSITLTAKISTGSQNGKDGADHYEFQEGHQEQVDADPSLTKYLSYTSNGSLTEEESGLHHKQSSIIWIRGAVLGRGAYGTVYRGLTNQGELIAAKQVRILDSGPELVRKEYKKLQEEVDLLKTLTHPNIVGYLGTSFEDSVVTIFMEFVPGGSISSNLSQFGPLKEAVISKYTSHILQGTSYLHKNRVVHRDIKGNNVMLMPNGVIKLIDFGCAKRLNSLSINGTRGKKLYSLKGTPYWMAPEVISESGHEEKSDIWSIGCTVYEMATGKPPLAHMDRLVAMFYIGADKGPMPILPDHFSKHAREFVNLCFTRDQDIRPSAEQLLQHPFVCLT